MNFSDQVQVFGTGSCNCRFGIYWEAAKNISSHLVNYETLIMELKSIERTIRKIETRG